MPALPTLVGALLVAAAAASPVQQLLESVTADSLVGPLGRLEASHRGPTGAEAALTLGRLHYARGEYRQAAAAFARATPRFGPARRAEARYWTGLAWLGAGEVTAARGAFEEAARGGSPRRPEALLGAALCWEAAKRPERALETLQALLAEDPREAGPAALERTAALAGALQRPELARRARERLASEYPRSFEAMRAGPLAAASPRPVPRPAASSGMTQAARVMPPPAAVRGPLGVQIGVFGEEAAARALAERARRSGFAPVRVSAVTQRGDTLYAVRVGVYATAEDARSAGERLGRSLGVSWRVVPTP